MNKDQKYFPCADCEAEGVDFLHPIEQFFVYKAMPHKPAGKSGHGYSYRDNLRRSRFCRRHTGKRNAARVKPLLDPTSPQYNPELHERTKEIQRNYYHRKKAKAQTS
jgi:hypothetical protein